MRLLMVVHHAQKGIFATSDDRRAWLGPLQSTAIMGRDRLWWGNIPLQTLFEWGTTMRWPWQKKAGTGKTAAALAAAKKAYAAGSRATQAGRFDEAAAAFERAAALVPEWPEAHINAGSVCYQLGLNSPEASRALWLGKAEGHFVAALRLAPENVSASLNLAATLHAQGRADEALGVLESLAGDYPDLRDVHYNLAVAYAQAGDLDRARASVDEELRRYPSHRAAGELRGRLG